MEENIKKLLCLTLFWFVACQTFDTVYNVPDNEHPKYKVRVRGWSLFSNTKSQVYPISMGQLHILNPKASNKNSDEEVQTIAIYTNIANTEKLMEASGNLAVILQTVTKKTEKAPDDAFSKEQARSTLLEKVDPVTQPELVKQIKNAKTLLELNKITISGERK